MNAKIDPKRLTDALVAEFLTAAMQRLFTDVQVAELLDKAVECGVVRPVEDVAATAAVTVTATSTDFERQDTMAEGMLRLKKRMQAAFQAGDYAEAQRLADIVFVIGFAHVRARNGADAWVVTDKSCLGWQVFQGNLERCIAYHDGYQEVDYYENLVVCVADDPCVIVYPECWFGRVPGEEPETGGNE
jgi:hypothetical protein